MPGNEIFALAFILTAMVGAYTCIFLDLGGMDALYETVVRVIKSHKKRKDI